MSSIRYILPGTILASFATVILTSACSTSSQSEAIPVAQVVSPFEDYSSIPPALPETIPVPMKPLKTSDELLKEVKLYKDLIPAGTHARKKKRRMNPRYITIHSTQNYSASADAWRHSLALKNGKLRATKRKNGNRIGYLAWHYTTDQNVTVQHIPDNEQGEHADYDGPGNNYSIGIEMCENHGNNRYATIERTAKLTAYLMFKHDIPLKNVVPHYHWPREGLSKPNKNCPHFLLDNGKPGAKWAGYLAKVQQHYDSFTVPVPQLPIQEPSRPAVPTYTLSETVLPDSPAAQYHKIYGL